MKIKRLLMVGASVLFAFSLGSMVHASADTTSDSYANVIAELTEPVNEQNLSTSNVVNNTSTIPANNNVQNQTTATVQSQADVVSHKTNVNYYTRLKVVRQHQRGYAIYKSPYQLDATPVAYQSKLSGAQIHVWHHILVNHHDWVGFSSKLKGINWINAQAVDTTTRWFYVPLISQRPQLPSGCEIVATTMMLDHATGRYLSKTHLANMMPRSSNPYYGFVGSPYSYSGWWIEPHGLMGVVDHYTHGHAMNMTGASIAAIKRQINKSRPVVVWMGSIDGFPNHGLTVYGYDAGHLYINDPWAVCRRDMSNSSVYYHRAADVLKPFGALSYY